MDLNRDFSEFIACCVEREVRASGRLQDLADVEALTDVGSQE
jgi:hypothetical protein